MVVLRAEREEGWLILGYTPRPPPFPPPCPRVRDGAPGEEKRRPEQFHFRAKRLDASEALLAVVSKLQL